MTSRNSFTGPSRTIDDSRPSTSLTRPSNRFMIQQLFTKQEQTNELRLEELIDPQAEFENFQNHGLKVFKPEILYHKGLLESGLA